MPDRHFVHGLHAREEGPEVVEVQVVAGVHAEPEGRGRRGRIRIRADDRLRRVSRESLRVGLGVELHSVGADLVGEPHDVDDGIHEEAHTAAELVESLDRGSEGGPLRRAELDEIPAMVAGERLARVGNERRLSWSRALAVLDEPVEGVAFDVVLGRGMAAHDTRDRLDVVEADMPLVGTGMHGDAVGARGEGDLRQTAEIGDPMRPRISEGRDLVDVDGELGHGGGVHSGGAQCSARPAIDTPRGDGYASGVRGRRSHFARELEARRSGAEDAGRTWVFLPYDQLHDGMGLLAEREPTELGVLLVESPGKAARRPYHQQKLALVLANLRHFAIEQAARGVSVRHVVAGRRGYAGAVEDLARELGRPLVVHEPAERELRVELAPLVGRALEVRPHDGWLTSEAQFRRSNPAGPPFRMDPFYRLVRRELGILMDGGKPVGGRFSFDAENRKPWKGSPPAPPLLRYPSDPIKEEVATLVRDHYAGHPGEVNLDALPATKADAEATWRFAVEACLPHFGPYEDAMSTRSSSLFHTRISPLLNLHRLLPRRVLADALSAKVPLGSQEGFVRQLLGWREFVRHVHRETDGLRAIPDFPTSGADPSALGARRPLPPAYWGTPSGLACLDHVVADVFREGYSHHITRLMVLGNLATLLDVSPRELTDWFWFAYVDAYDWVVEPNVLAMATFGAGDVMTTKPYVAGAAYIDRMSDYCRTCRFDPKRTCPITPLYWAFLARHEGALSRNRRIGGPLVSLRRRDAERRARDARTFETVSRLLSAGREVGPEDLP